MDGRTEVPIKSKGRIGRCDFANAASRDAGLKRHVATHHNNCRRLKVAVIWHATEVAGVSPVTEANIPHQPL